jgi:hypothetical protein
VNVVSCNNVSWNEGRRATRWIATVVVAILGLVTLPSVSAGQALGTIAGTVKDAP